MDFCKHLDFSRNLRFSGSLDFSKNLDFFKNLDFSKKFRCLQTLDFSKNLYSFKNLEFSKNLHVSKTFSIIPKISIFGFKISISGFKTATFSSIFDLNIDFCVQNFNWRKNYSIFLKNRVLWIGKQDLSLRPILFILYMLIWRINTHYKLLKLIKLPLPNCEVLFC